MRAFNVLLSILISFAMGLSVFEGGLRLIGFAPTESITQFDESLGWKKRPNASVRRSTSEFDIELKTNSTGLRDDEIPEEKPADEHRVLCLGDSFVLGYTVDRHDLFVDLLEKSWREEGREVQVINGGTEGWSTDQEVLWYLEESAKLQADTVILFAYENDIYYCGERNYTRYPKPRFNADGLPEPAQLENPGSSSLSQRFAIGRFLSFLRSQVRPGREAELLSHGDARIPFEFGPLLNDQPPQLAEAKERLRGALIALRARCERDGSRLLICPIPSESAIHPAERQRFQEGPFAKINPDDWSPDAPVDYFLSTASGLNIHTLDPRAGMRAAAEDGPLYFEEEWHFTPRGNQVLAQLLYEELSASLPLKTADSSPPRLPQSPQSSEWPYWYSALVLLLGALYASSYRKEESIPSSYFKVAALLAVVFTIVLSVESLLGALSPTASGWTLGLFILSALGFIAYKLGPRIDTILELLFAFVLRGHWYLMPLVTILLTIGSLLLVAASSPLIAPFIYTLF